ncbi:NERD domain-containing protein [Microbispora triticiradicis]|uniref:NERD domain-containing protein n=3 Tax=Microbispora TaxID=2005 RepID=A0ABY3M3E6_9ACTN|nr:NERD domain-containing protein [Microbispora triticiradicis]RGA01367.1 NERD domain-containing protein [Microbispora triticiradicis]TLP56176.1 NERD domain-containing protein [Microbispora fusca]TYB65546.1 NERD domain-containing protein [Microbispora tritici]
MSDVDTGLRPEDGHDTSPIWVGDQSSEQAERPSAPPEAAAPPEYAPVERASLRGLLQDPRYRHLRRRALIAAAAGVVFGVLLGGWRIGLTAAILAWAADAVYRARTMSTVPAWRRASAAERRTEAQLKKLERNGYLTLHARAIPGSEAQIDHLVVGPTGVYAVDSEKWDKRLPVRVQTHRKLFHGPFNRKPRLDEARWEAAQASDLISKALGREITVVPSLAIYGPAIPWRILNIRDVDVFSGGLVRKWITKRERSLTTAEIDAIYRAAERVLPARYPE